MNVLQRSQRKTNTIRRHRVSQSLDGVNKHSFKETHQYKSRKSWLCTNPGHLRLQYLEVLSALNGGLNARRGTNGGQSLASVEWKKKKIIMCHPEHAADQKSLSLQTDPPARFELKAPRESSGIHLKPILKER